jgi:hypothetical protein
MKSGKAAIITTVLLLVAMMVVAAVVTNTIDDKKLADAAVAANVAAKAAAAAKAKADARPNDEKIAEMLKSVATLGEKDYNTRREWYEQIVALAPENKDYKAKRAYYAKLHDIELAKTVAANAKAEREAKAAKRKEGVRNGMDQQAVLDSSWGRPASTHRTTFAGGGVSEYWHYDSGSMLHFSNGVLDSISTRN